MLEEVNQRFRQLWNQLNKDNLDQLSSLYAPDAVFIDPIHQINGLDDLTDYCRNLYANVMSIQFDYEDVSFGPQFFHQDWTMTFRHPKMNKGAPITVSGSTRVRVNQAGQIIEHRDYFDVGEMIYRNIPIFGSCIEMINRRITS